MPCRMICCLVIILFLVPCQSFCIYNLYTDGTTVNVKQESETWPLTDVFSVENLQPGDRACCHYSNKDCNLHGDREAFVTFGIKVVPKEGNERLYRVDTSAGGTIEFTGDMNNGSITAYNYDNTMLSTNPKSLIVEYMIL
ncbi:hypothetical protein CLU79DRAFT_892207 [Phycomyces nitens]|nr:hypothetical protein CLU79DRAFT_892207 [Phycomyces nitens]